MLLTSLGLFGVLVAPCAAAQPAPSGAHPRIWLDAATQSGMRAQAGVANGAVARGAKRCAAARAEPSEYAMGGWQGFEWVTTLSGCLVSWIAAGNEDDLVTAIKYWNVLLDDYQTVGDGLGGDTVVTHDTGYAMRTFAPYSALAYDWLHDAPGVTESLRARSRARFDAWSTFYSTSGYLRDVPGANYQAGYVFAATLMAIAEAGEAGAAGDAHWANVRDVIWKADMVPAFAEGGVLEGGDWPEGWQYGPLSVLEHSLAARAMQDNGMPIAGASSWASSLPLRFAYGLTPVTNQTYVAGDSDDTSPHREPTNGALLAAVVGPASDQAKAWARKLNADLGLSNENPLFDALATAASGPSEALPEDAPTNYLARGTGNWYLRGAWTSETAWSVFQCAPQLVPDHQHTNAGNWVLTRGADDLVVDPSPYGSLSTLTGNAPAIDSAVLPSNYSPSQGLWGVDTAMVWARQSNSGVAAGRCDYADQFRRSDVPSDVAHALRDYVFVPNGSGATVVIVDRAVTGSADRGLHLRVRTPASLALAGDIATGTLGESSLGIRKIWATSGSANVRAMPQATECPSSDHTCDVSRLSAGTEYRLDVAGPAALAIHVVDAQSGSGASAAGELLSGSGYRGALIAQGTSSVAVITNDAADGARGDSLVYRVPAADGGVHVVVDAPVNPDGVSEVRAARDGDHCKVEVTPHQGATEGFSGRPLIVRTSSTCAISDDGAQAATDPGSNGPQAVGPDTGPDAGTGGSASVNGGASGASIGTNAAAGSAGTASQELTSAMPGAGTVTGSCALSARRSSTGSIALLALGAMSLWLLGRRRRVAKLPAGQKLRTV
jgi:hypothetical protein